MTKPKRMFVDDNNPQFSWEAEFEKKFVHDRSWAVTDSGQAIQPQQIKQFISDNFISKKELEKVVPEKEIIGIKTQHKEGFSSFEVNEDMIKGYNYCRKEIQAKIKSLKQ